MLAGQPKPTYFLPGTPLINDKKMTTIILQIMLYCESFVFHNIQDCIKDFIQLDFDSNLIQGFLS